MEFLRVVLFFILFECVICNFEIESVFKPCPVEDSECMKKSSELFIQKTSPGIPEYDIKPFDPAFLPMVCVEGGKDIVIHFRNVSIFGLKDSKATDFKIDTTSKSVELKTKQDVLIAADIFIVFEDTLKTFHGTWTAQASTVCDAHYNFAIVKDNNDTERFRIIPDIIDCESPEEPIVKLDEDLQKALETDPDATKKMEEYASHRTQNQKTVVSKMMNEAFAIAVYNLAAACKVMLRSDFFTNY